VAVHAWKSTEEVNCNRVQNIVITDHHVCMPVHKQISKTRCPRFTEFLEHIAFSMVWSSFGSIAIRYVLHVLWIHKKGVIQCMLEVTQQRGTLGQNLASMTALFILRVKK